MRDAGSTVDDGDPVFTNDIGECRMVKIERRFREHHATAHIRDGERSCGGGGLDTVECGSECTHRASGNGERGGNLGNAVQGVGEDEVTHGRRGVIEEDTVFSIHMGNGGGCKKESGTTLCANRTETGALGEGQVGEGSRCTIVEQDAVMGTEFTSGIDIRDDSSRGGDGRITACVDGTRVCIMDGVLIKRDRCIICCNDTK